MLTTIYYSLAIIAYSIFLIQFILTLFGAVDLDMDIDLDCDGDADLSWGDVISFKGLIHFLMGSMGWLSIKSLTSGAIMWYDYLIALFVGILFFLILYWLYKLMMKLENKPKVLSGKDLIGKEATIYLINGAGPQFNNYTILVNNGIGTIEVSALSKEEHSINDSVIITDYQNGYYVFK